MRFQFSSFSVHHSHFCLNFMTIAGVNIFNLNLFGINPLEWASYFDRWHWNLWISFTYVKNFWIAAVHERNTFISFLRKILISIWRIIQIITPFLPGDTGGSLVRTVRLPLDLKGIADRQRPNNAYQATINKDYWWIGLHFRAISVFLSFW